jgi:hypothetical protein
MRIASSFTPLFDHLTTTTDTFHDENISSQTESLELVQGIAFLFPY